MRLRIDPEVCATTGQCASALPEVFRLDENGIAQVIVTDVPPQLHEPARDAVGRCPVAAIEVVADDR